MYIVLLLQYVVCSLSFVLPVHLKFLQDVTDIL